MMIEATGFYFTLIAGIWIFGTLIDYLGRR